MHIVNWRRILLILTLFAPASLLASTCATTIHTIHTDLTDHSDSIDHHYRWANLRWLEKNFGEPSTRVSAKGAIYFWRCDAANFLSVDSDTANKTMLVSGQYNDDNGAGVFSVEVNSGFVGVHSNSYHEVMAASHTPLPPTSAMNPLTAGPAAEVTPAPMRTNPVKPQVQLPGQLGLPAVKPEPVAARGVAPAAVLNKENNSAQDFKNWFNVDVQSQNQLGDVALQKIVDYYSKLRTCTPGNYTYPIFNADPTLQGKHSTPLFFLSNSTIAGMKHGRCLVNTISNLPRHLQHTRCAFTPATLKHFTADNAKLTLVRDMEHNHRLEPNMRAIKHECRSDFKAPRAELTTHFAESLKVCLPGKYKVLKPYPIKDSAGQTAQAAEKYFIQEFVIAGYKNGKCQVEGKTETYGQTVTTQCSYSPDSLNFVANKELKMLADNSGAAVDRTDVVSAAQALQECKYR